ncbi:MAG: hypothetical protein H7293_08490 [Candidatus Saccharibacteria bacterium]|nr:hypothetical protein [Rhodoferax sp.]
MNATSVISPPASRPWSLRHPSDVGLRTGYAMLADPKLGQREADAKAIGGTSRHGLRSIEECYSLNEKWERAAIFASWKDMHQTMRHHKIEGVAPQGLKPATAAPAPLEEVMLEDPKAKASAKTGTKAKPG